MLGAHLNGDEVIAMAEQMKTIETWRPNVPKTQDSATKYGAHDVPDAKAPEQPNPSDPGNTGTTPGTNAKVG